MNKLLLLNLLIILICFNPIKTQKQLTAIELKIDKLLYLVGDLITVDVIVSNLPVDKDVIIEMKANSNKDSKNLLECLDCSPKVFKNKLKYNLTKNQSDQNKIQFKWRAKEASRLTLYIETNLSKSELDKTKIQFKEIGIIKSKEFSIISDIIGWTYFTAWTLCFYPQVLVNFRTKSCDGLNIDYCILNFVGFAFYAVFNSAMYFSEIVQDEYEKVNPYSNIPVLSNDIAFSIHHSIISFVIYVQCAFIYKNGNQTYSRPCIIANTAVFSGFLLLGLYNLQGKFSLLDFIYYCGYVKMVFTLLKFLPQAYSNFKRKSTEGFSSFYIYLDLIGGSSCLIQMFILIHKWKKNLF